MPLLFGLVALVILLLVALTLALGRVAHAADAQEERHARRASPLKNGTDLEPIRPRKGPRSAS